MPPATTAVNADMAIVGRLAAAKLFRLSASPLSGSESPLKTLPPPFKVPISPSEEALNSSEADAAAFSASAIRLS